MVNLNFDQDGFLLDPQTWDESLASFLAREDGLGDLKPEQWSVLRSLRSHYFRTGNLPALPHICNSQRLDPACMTHFFPSAREAWRLAGLPNPGEEAKAYM